MRRRSAGFSLIELLIVVAIMGILAAVAIPSLSPSVHDQLQGAAQVVASDLAYGASLALANNSHYEFTFDLPQNRYVLEHSGGNSTLDVLPRTAFRSALDPPQQHIFDLDELPQLGGGVRLAAVQTATAPARRVPRIEFDPLGATTQPDEVVIWLAAGVGNAARYVTIHVDPATGLSWPGEYSGTGPAAALAAGASPIPAP